MRQLSHLAFFATIIMASTAFVSAADKTKTITAKDIKKVMLHPDWPMLPFIKVAKNLN